MSNIVTTQHMYLFKFKLAKVVTRACNSGTWKAEAEILDQFEISLGHIARPSLKKKVIN